MPLVLSRTPRFLVALLAILKAGGTCVPIDPSYPAPRILYMLEQAEATVLGAFCSKSCYHVRSQLILTERLLRDKIPASYSAAVVVLMDSESEVFL